MATRQDYVNEIRSGRPVRYLVKVEIMDMDENVLEEIVDDIIDGSITLNNVKGIRRTGDLRLKNNDGKYSPDLYGSIWLDKKLKLYNGIMIGEEEFYEPQGVFLISEVQTESDGANREVVLTLMDKMSMINGVIAGKIVDTYIVPIGSNVSAVVSAIMGFAQDPQFPLVTVSATTNPYTIAKDAGSTYDDILSELSNLYSWDYWYDVNGTFRFEPPEDYNYITPTWDFTTDEVFYMKGNRRYKFNEVKNSIYVNASNINGSPIRASAKDIYYPSPTSIYRLGERIEHFQDDIISTVQQAQDRADYELLKLVILQEQIDISCFPIITIKEDDVITLVDEGIDINERHPYYIQSISRPLLGNSEMTLSCWKTRPLE